MAERPRIGCGQYTTCLVECGNDDVCASMCTADVTSQGRILFNRAIRCAQSWCLGYLADLGMPDCVLDETGMRLTDPPGRMSCDACLLNATAALFGQPCSPPADRNCNPTACAAAVDACLAN